MINYFMFCLDKPGQSEFLKPDSITDTEITLKWSEPQDDGGCDILGYHVEIREASRRTWQRCGHVAATCDRQFTAKSLRKNERYLMRVAAENEVGVGEFAELSETVLTKGKIGQKIYKLFSVT